MIYDLRREHEEEAFVARVTSLCIYRVDVTTSRDFSRKFELLKGEHDWQEVDRHFEISEKLVSTVMKFKCRNCEGEVTGKRRYKKGDSGEVS